MCERGKGRDKKVGGKKIQVKGKLRKRKDTSIILIREQKDNKRGCSRVVNFVFFSVDSLIYLEKIYVDNGNWKR